jgi:hypothetical protein
MKKTDVMLYMNELMEALLNDMTMVASGDQFDQMKKTDAMLYMNELVDVLLNDMTMIVSGDQFYQMKKTDAMLYHLFVDILQKVVNEMAVIHLYSSSFSMIISNPIHFVITFVIQVDMGMNDDTAVEMVAEDCTMVMKIVVYEMLMMFDSEE